MEWLVLALLSPAFWALCNIIDKYLLDKRFDSPFSYQIFVSFLMLIYLPLLWFLIEPLDLMIALPLVAWGFVTTFAYVSYNKALMMEETSRISSIDYTHPFLVAVMAFFFLGEVLSPLNYAGIALLVSSAFLASYRQGGSTKRALTVLALMLVFMLVISSFIVFAKWYLEFASPWSILFWTILGGLPASLVMLSFKPLRKNFNDTRKRMRTRDYALFFIATTSYLVALSLFYNALSQGPVSLVTAVGSVQPFIVFAYALFLSVWFPKFLYEEHSRLTIVLKSLAALLIVLGTYLVSV